MSEETRVAVVGLAACFPGAPDLGSYRRNLQVGHDAITEAPPSRWDPLFHQPGAGAVDRVSTRRGGFLPERIAFPAAAFGVMPRVVEGTEPDQLLTLQAASQCLEDAGGLEGVDRRRVSVILGRGGYLTPGLVRLGQKVREAQQLASVLAELAPELDRAVLDRVKRAFQGAAGRYGPDTAIGLVPNLAASRVANRLDLQGAAYTLDAACASSLLAVEHGVRDLRAGRSELVLVGGVHLAQDITFWSVFEQLGALSASGRLRAYDRRADGLVIGEGVGLLALMRLDRARAQGRRIYALLHGVGSASDGRAASVMVPRVAGQVLALRRAWEDAGQDPAELELLEGHGTGTKAGDAAELRTVAEVFGAEGRPAVLGSVKTMIGHTMPAAGAAGLIKAVLAVHDGLLPPSLHCEEPHADLRATRFEVLGEARPWDGGPRLAAVNAFGFGGINAHVVLGAHDPPSRRRRPRKPTDDDDVPVLHLAADSREELLARLQRGERRGGRGPCRLALVDPTPARLERAVGLVRKGQPWTGRGGIWFRDAGLLGGGGRLAFVFPGIEAGFRPDAAPVAAHFGLPEPAPMEPRDLEETGRGVVALGRFLHEVLGRIGLRPDLVAGHSIGEWTGMIVTGLLPDEAVDAFLARAAPGSLEVPGVLFAAAGCGPEQAERAMRGLPEIAVSHDNCPHQVVLCGVEPSIEEARRRLLAEGVICRVLPFRSGFHSPLFADYLEPHRRNIGSLPLAEADPPLWSSTTCAPYPADPEAVRALFLRHLVEPLRFRELVERLYEEGARVFVQVGTGSLPGFIDDTLADREHLAVSASVERRPGFAQLRNLALALWVEGADVDLGALLPYEPRGPTVDLRLGTPLLRLGPELEGVLASGPALPSADDPVGAAFAGAMRAWSRAGGEVVRALRAKAPGPRTHREVRTLSVRTVPALRDHALFPQPEGWPVVSDGHPVVPMTMTVELLMEVARALQPGAVVTAVEDLQAFKWLVVEPEERVELRAELRADGAVRAEVVGYAEATVRLAPRWPEAPEPAFALLPDGEAAPATPGTLYRDRWMFHGPAYRGVVGIGRVSAAGIEGRIRVPEGPGALLDNAGQLIGLWLMARAEQDRMALPVGVERLEFFGPAPAVGEELECRVRIPHHDATSLRGDAELLREGRVWARVTGWTDHRFPADEHLWLAMRRPERLLLSEAVEEVRFFDEAAHRLPPRDWLIRRYLGEAERAAMLAAGPRGQRTFLLGRIVAKDAVRALLREEGGGPLFPVEVPLGPDPAPATEPHGAAEGVAVAAAVVEGCAVAIAGRGPVAVAAEAVGPGVDGAGAAFLPAQDPASLTRLRAARRVAADRLGLSPDGAARLPVEDEGAGRLRVGGVLVRTLRRGELVVAWSRE